MKTPRRVPLLRAGAGLCVLVAAVLSLTALNAAHATTVSPDKTAWYDTTGLQNYTGEKTPSLASHGQLEVAYVPIGVTIPKEDVPALPITPPTLPPASPVQIPVPDIGSVGGNTLGDTLAFAAVQYTVPLEAGGESINPSSLRAVLTVSLDPETTALGSGDILACPTTNTLWAGGGDQDSGQAAPFDCSPGDAVTGDYDGSSHTLTFDLSSAQEYVNVSGVGTGIFSLVLAPSLSPTGPFTAVIEPPSATSFAVTDESPASSPGDNLSGGGSVLLPTAPSGAGAATGFGFSGSGTGAAPASSPLPSEGFSMPLPATPLAVASPAGTTQGAVGQVATTPEAIARALSTGSQRSIGVILLLAVAAGLWLAASSSRHQPRSLRRSHTPA